MIRPSAGSPPAPPPSSTPPPPYTFSRYFAPSCTAIRPATSLIGVSKGSSPDVTCTVSSAIATIPDLITACVSDSDAAKWKYVNTTWPLRMHGHSGSIGSFTLTTISALAHTSAALGTSVPPATRYASSANPEPIPAPCSTSTLCPSPTSDSTPAGTRATRCSAVLISLGTPTIMPAPRRDYIHPTAACLKFASELATNGSPLGRLGTCQ